MQINGVGSWSSKALKYKNLFQGNTQSTQNLKTPIALK